jgi:CMP-N-acetylneuraminic acid synthetase
MKTIAIIPARGGSKRLPGKNILPLGGLPLIAHSILYALANPEIIDEVYVSTDDAAIKDVAIRYGAKVIDRPQDISGDHEPTVSALQHVVSLHNDVENVVLLQPTNPFRPESLLRECWKKFSDESRDSLFTVTRNYQKFGKISGKNFVPYNYAPGQRSQDLEPLYFENGLLYICTAALIRAGKVFSDNAFPFIVDDITASVDIDTIGDFEYAAYVHQKINTTI